MNPTSIELYEALKATLPWLTEGLLEECGELCSCVELGTAKTLIDLFDPEEERLRDAIVEAALLWEWADQDDHLNVLGKAITALENYRRTK